MTVVGRFAPSPTGRMHLGNVYCALLSYLSVKSRGGRWILRIEDLDPDRSRLEYARWIEDDLHWLGLDWDEGGLDGGEWGACCQSRRTESYRLAFESLQAEVYPCFCKRADLLAASAPHASDGRVVYAGTCRTLSPERVEQLSLGRRPAYRLRLPDETISFEDRHYGRVTVDLAKECGDFILRRADGVYAYNLAVVVDDAAMGVTEVVRGVDLLPVTPEQLYLYRLLKLEAPVYCHLPLLVDASGRRLCKRNRDLEMGVLRQAGGTPRRLLGRLACWAGLQPDAGEVSLDELCRLFEWNKVPTRDVVAGLEL